MTFIRATALFLACASYPPLYVVQAPSAGMDLPHFGDAHREASSGPLPFWLRCPGCCAPALPALRAVLKAELD
jgi:hypothetical protein